MNEPSILVSTRNRHAIRFPAIAFHKDCIIIYKNINSMTTTSLWAYNNNYYEGALILAPASKGGHAVYEVVEIEKQRSLINMVLPLLLSLRIDMHVREITDATIVETLKSKLLADIREGGASEEREDYEQLEARAEGCGTIADIFDVVAGDFVAPDDDELDD